MKKQPNIIYIVCHDLGKHLGCYGAMVEELYHITNDPQEFINLAQRPEYRKIKETMAAKLDKWMQETDDLALTDKIPQPPNPVGWGGWPENVKNKAWK